MFILAKRGVSPNVVSNVMGVKENVSKESREPPSKLPHTKGFFVEGGCLARYASPIRCPKGFIRVFGWGVECQLRGIVIEQIAANGKNPFVYSSFNGGF